jgi:hypothetical protein
MLFLISSILHNGFGHLANFDFDNVLQLGWSSSSYFIILPYGISMQTKMKKPANLAIVFFNQF